MYVHALECSSFIREFSWYIMYMWMHVHAKSEVFIHYAKVKTQEVLNKPSGYCPHMHHFVETQKPWGNAIHTNIT